MVIGRACLTFVCSSLGLLASVCGLIPRRCPVRLAGRFSPAPSGAGEDDRSGSVGSLDLERDDSFASVLSLIREFHNMEEPAGVAPNRCETSLAPVYGLQSESSPALHLPTSPLLESLIEDVH